MGVVNNARYLEYFEAGRNDLLRKLGLPYTGLEKMNVGLPVIEANVKFIQPAKYDDLLIIRAEILNFPGVRFRIDYSVMLDELLLATGFTVHAFIDLHSLRPVRPPAEFMKILKSCFDENRELL